MNSNCCNYNASQLENSLQPRSRYLHLVRACFSHLCVRAKAHYHVKKQQRIDRDAFRRLVALDDAALKDIGVTRNDVIWASQLPLSQNASLELEKIARQPKRW